MSAQLDRTDGTPPWWCLIKRASERGWHVEMLDNGARFSKGRFVLPVPDLAGFSPMQIYALGYLLGYASGYLRGTADA